jgi:phage tail-like protein
MANPTDTIRALDSLVANEFAVSLDGELVSGIFSIEGLVTFKLDVKTTTAMKKLQEPFVIKKMVQRDPNNLFNTWIRATFAAGADIVRPTRTLTITAIDNNVPTRRWTVKKAWISEIKYSDFNSGSGELVEEIVTIQYEDIDESWPLLDAPQGALPDSTH